MSQSIQSHRKDEHVFLAEKFSPHKPRQALMTCACCMTRCRKLPWLMCR